VVVSSVISIIALALLVEMTLTHFFLKFRKPDTSLHFCYGFGSGLRLKGFRSHEKDMLIQVYHPCHVTNSTNRVQLMGK